MQLAKFLELTTEEQYKTVMAAELTDKLCKVYLLNLQMAVQQKKPALVQYNENLLNAYYKLVKYENNSKGQ